MCICVCTCVCVCCICGRNRLESLPLKSLKVVCNEKMTWAYIVA